MDTKLKNNSGRRGAGLFISIVILSLLASAVLLFYKPIVENAKGFIETSKSTREKDLENLKESEEDTFLENLFKSNYVLKWELERQIDNKKYSASDIFSNNTGVFDITENTENADPNDSYEAFKDDFNEMMDSWNYEFFYTTLPSYQLEYYVVDNKTGNYLTNTGAKFSALLNDKEDAKNIKDGYYFCTMMQFDKDGNLSIPYFQGLSNEKKNAYLSFNLTQQMVDRNWNNAAWYASRVKRLAGMTVVYGVKSASLLQSDYLSQEDYMSYWVINEAYNRGGAVYLYAGSFLLVMLLGFLLPAIKPLGIGKGIEAKVPVEIWGLGMAFTFAIYEEGILTLIKETVTGDVFLLSGNHIFNEGIASAVVNVFNILVWLFIFFVWFAAALSIRELFIKKPVRYLKENTLTFRFLGWVGRVTKRGYHYVTSFDMSKKDNKKLILLLGGNLFLMILFCSMWGVGIFGAIIYTGVLFYFINKYKKKVTADYKAITEAAVRISEGNLEGTIDEDLGIFNPLKEQLMKVQQGFRKAVLEETKSQKMKTELITNVSHDLKTPLTAIITYVDLLKDKNLTEEQIDSYIETLDRKALRLKILIEDLFEMSKAASNTIAMNPVEVDLTALIKQLHFELSDRIEKADIDFRARIPEEKVVAWLDSDKTYRIFENLLINMCKYTLPNSRAYLDMELKEKEVFVTVRNISQAELDFSGEEIVERFVRGDKARNSEGSGLGLAIAKSFTELQGGTFQVITDGDLFKVVVGFKIL
ncbi:HAMP domain-containing sensor histidine kinase [Anaerocolumna xylanovorans]|uniref:HAMP domain-containing sensor histidine kinase n=1 Tax=Anaerocolumna xylanovorans TaxID=100134 RepID=UPI001114DBF4|nr:HAMP domain-containing sensor histidine kinase [Anaerocolumna xylanovorans]